MCALVRMLLVTQFRTEVDTLTVESQQATEPLTRNFSFKSFKVIYASTGLHSNWASSRYPSSSNANGVVGPPFLLKKGEEHDAVHRFGPSCLNKGTQVLVISSRAKDSSIKEKACSTSLIGFRMLKSKAISDASKCASIMKATLKAIRARR